MQSVPQAFLSPLTSSIGVDKLFPGVLFGPIEESAICTDRPWTSIGVSTSKTLSNISASRSRFLQGHCSFRISRIFHYRSWDVHSSNWTVRMDMQDPSADDADRSVLTNGLTLDQMLFQEILKREIQNAGRAQLESQIVDIYALNMREENAWKSIFDMSKIMMPEIVKNNLDSTLTYLPLPGSDTYAQETTDQEEETEGEQKTKSEDWSESENLSSPTAEEQSEDDIGAPTPVAFELNDVQQFQVQKLKFRLKELERSELEDYTIQLHENYCLAKNKRKMLFDKTMRGQL